MQLASLLPGIFLFVRYMSLLFLFCVSYIKKKNAVKKCLRYKAHGKVPQPPESFFYEFRIWKAGKDDSKFRP
jgi:hypothetical protein